MEDSEPCDLPILTYEATFHCLLSAYEGIVCGVTLHASMDSTEGCGGSFSRAMYRIITRPFPAQQSSELDIDSQSLDSSIIIDMSMFSRNVNNVGD